jgi:hypothetical protein
MEIGSVRGLNVFQSIVVVSESIWEEHCGTVIAQYKDSHENAQTAKAIR